MKNLPIKLFTIILSIVILFLTIKGSRETWNNPSQYDSAVGGAFESSNNSSRYVLTKSIAERNSFILNVDEAKIASPDVAENNNKYFSLFMPGLSMIAIPLYKIGLVFGQPQVTSYLINILLAIINGVFIYKISRKLVNNDILAIVSGMIYVFGTNSWAYALGFTQHQASTTIVLLSLLIIQKGRKTILSQLTLGILYGFGLLLDFPNLIIMFPVVILLFLQMEKIQLGKVASRVFIFLAGVIPMFLLFFYYNIQTTGSALSSAQFLGRSLDFSEEKNQLVVANNADEKGKSGIQLPFRTRHQVQGLTILMTSSERGWFYYSPVLILAVIGLLISLKKNDNLNFNRLTLSVIGLNILIYAMFGDPWGGWSFGPRYLIPATAVLLIYLPFFFLSSTKKYILLIVFVIAAAYSINLSSLGALTTSSIPPKQEAEKLVTPIPHTPELNKEFIKTKTSSLTYNLYFNKYMTPQEYHAAISLLVVVYISLLTTYGLYKKN